MKVPPATFIRDPPVGRVPGSTPGGIPFQTQIMSTPSSGLEAVAEADLADGETVTVSDGNTLYIVTTGSDEAWLVASLSGRNVTANTENNR